MKAFGSVGFSLVTYTVFSNIYIFIYVYNMLTSVFALNIVTFTHTRIYIYIRSYMFSIRYIHIVVHTAV
jgi:hypothetical protein